MSKNALPHLTSTAGADEPYYTTQDSGAAQTVEDTCVTSKRPVEPVPSTDLLYMSTSPQSRDATDSIIIVHLCTFHPPLELMYQEADGDCLCANVRVDKATERFEHGVMNAAVPHNAAVNQHPKSVTFIMHRNAGHLPSFLIF